MKTISQLLGFRTPLVRVDDRLQVDIRIRPANVKSVLEMEKEPDRMVTSISERSQSYMCSACLTPSLTYPCPFCYY